MLTSFVGNILYFCVQFRPYCMYFAVNKVYCFFLHGHELQLNFNVKINAEQIYLKIVFNSHPRLSKSSPLYKNTPKLLPSRIEKRDSCKTSKVHRRHQKTSSVCFKCAIVSRTRANL